MVTVEGALPPGRLIETITSAYTDPHFTLKTSVLVDVRQSAANPTSTEVQQASRVIVRIAFFPSAALRFMKR